MQARAADDLKRLVCERLDKAQLTYDRADAFVTPRRLALVVVGLPERQPDQSEERRGPGWRSFQSDRKDRMASGRAIVRART